jgi:hypothetical protein
LQGVDEFKLDESSSHSDGSVGRHPSVSGGHGSPTGRPLYAAAGPTPSAYDSVRFSPPETRSSIEQAAPRRHLRTTIPGVSYPIPPPSPQDFDFPTYASPTYQTQPPPPTQGQMQMIDYYRAAAATPVSQSFVYGAYPAIYTGGGFGPGYGPYLAQPAPPASPVYSLPSHQGMPLRRPKQSRTAHDKEGVGVLIQTY